MITLDSHINILGLSTRSTRGLRNDNIETIGQLIELAPHEVLRIPGLGRLSLNEITMSLSLYGFALRNREQDRLISKTKGKWQPIETAPKDDTDMLLFCGDGICIGSYAAGMFWFVQNDYELRDPTHWMPLPEPPALGEKKDD